MTPVVAAVDWGTSSFRLWLLDSDGTVLAEARSDEGMMRAREVGFGSVLDRHLAETGAPGDLPAIVCGMAGARQGWREAVYLDAPAALDRLAAAAISVEAGGRDVRILPGICQRDAEWPDVMRGEETQLLGAVAGGLGAGLVCMPGTHSKWVELREGAVERFATFMTGDIYAAMAGHSILKLAVEGQPEADARDPAFAEAVLFAAHNPQLAAARLFGIRAGPLLGLREPDKAASLLSRHADRAGDCRRTRPLRQGERRGTGGRRATGRALPGGVAGSGLCRADSRCRHGRASRPSARGAHRVGRAMMTAWPQLRRSLVAILRGVRPDEVEAIAGALFEAGFEAVEVPLNSPDPFRSIESVVRIAPAAALVGAGTVLDIAEVDRLADCGAGLMVSPNTDVAVIEHARARGLVTMPGVFTPTEALAAAKAGASALKFFPASVIGPEGIKAIRAVLPARLEVGAVGGVSDRDFAAYAAAGIRTFGLGSSLYRSGMAAGEVSERARAAVTAYDAAFASGPD